jgi:hypothetical protein
MARGGFRPNAGSIKRRDLLAPELPAPCAGSNSSSPRRSPLEYLCDLYNDETIDGHRRDRAAIAALPFLHKHARDIGIKETKQDKAEAISDIYMVPKVPNMPLDLRKFSS